ncbi:cupin domain-containing protein [Adhaeribacter swui]|uniref:Cupin domain-containing protein n=1 Tax=Adhaeribacter swui TaxID=2086471 RepID=A0A7G7G986_9BACT|nr:cupin domain-containing protein [Adhaeribacter swui]QNF33720.1 cupin domain-containing protein [Adhaeribacter swui]
MEINEALILNSGEGREIKVGTSRLFLKLFSERTNNKFSITEYDLPPNFPGPPSHKHRNYEHAWYVLEGVLSVEVNGKEMTLVKGDFIFIPKYVVHAFSNKSDSAVRLLAIDTPGGFENYYDELETAFTDGKPLDPNTFREIQLKYDTYPPDYSFE